MPQEIRGSTGPAISAAHAPGVVQSDQFYGGACAYLPEADDIPYDEKHYSETEKSGTLSELKEDQLSDSVEKMEQTEDMTYRETIRSVHSYMGWHHISTFESDDTEPNKSNNPWRKSQEANQDFSGHAPDDWLCQKLERLNLTEAEGYPSRAQHSAGLKRDQFI